MFSIEELHLLKKFLLEGESPDIRNLLLRIVQREIDRWSSEK
jgi:hypothetical protein